MRTHVVDHPLVAHKLTALRDENTDSPTFRSLADELVTLLAYEATREVRVDPYDIVTPVAPTTGVKLAKPKPLVVPILRAGLGMLDGMMRLLPTAEVGFLGMMRNEETLEATTYAERLPEDLAGRQCYVLDPMLATGGTLSAAIKFLTDRGANDITAICLLAAPEGCARLEADLAGLDVPVTVVTAAMDEKLNEKGYIVPGLGDAGDRLYGVVGLQLGTSDAVELGDLDSTSTRLSDSEAGHEAPRDQPVRAPSPQSAPCRGCPWRRRTAAWSRARRAARSRCRRSRGASIA